MVAAIVFQPQLQAKAEIEQKQQIFQRLSSQTPSALPYASLREWTGDFNSVVSNNGPHGLMGKGAFGEVFKGLAVPPVAIGEAAIRIAVKRMDVKIFQLDIRDGTQKYFITIFRREINVLIQFHHPNIVKEIGFSEPCHERHEPPRLVYELLALGSLAS